MTYGSELVDWYGFKIAKSNRPEGRAGVYMITHIETGCSYIGISNNVERRVLQHARSKKDSGTTRLHAAITKAGCGGFMVIPLFYNLASNTTGLALIEAALIKQHDTVANGYNFVSASRGAGPYGAAFCEAIHIAQAKPECRRKILEFANCPIQRAKRGLAIAAAHARPEVKAKLLARYRVDVAMLSKTPEAIAKRIATEASPETKARRSAAIKAMHAVPANKQIHLDAVRKATANPVRNAKISAARTGKVWITDGVSNRAVYPDSIPAGWRRGMLR